MKTRTLIASLLAGTSLAAPASAELTRLATIPVGAEVTGLYLTDGGDLFMNVQHPATAITGPFNKATVGYIANADFNALPENVEPISSAESQSAKQTVRTAMGEYRPLVQQGDFDDVIPGGIGAIVGADGTVLKVSNDPDFNGFIPSGEGEGYLFTNWEDRPGGMSRVKLEKDEDGMWVVGTAQAPQGSDDPADVLDVMMVDFTKVGGTWVNCFGSVSPWNTPLTSEELYFELRPRPGTTPRRKVLRRRRDDARTTPAERPTRTTTATSLKSRIRKASRHPSSTSRWAGSATRTPR